MKTEAQITEAEWKELLDANMKDVAEDQTFPVMAPDNLKRAIRILAKKYEINESQCIVEKHAGIDGAVIRCAYKDKSGMLSIYV